MFGDEGMAPHVMRITFGLHDPSSTTGAASGGFGSGAGRGNVAGSKPVPSGADPGPVMGAAPGRGGIVEVDPGPPMDSDSNWSRTCCCAACPCICPGIAGGAAAAAVAVPNAGGPASP